MVRWRFDGQPLLRYTTVPEAPVYREIMEIFAEASAGYTGRLSPEEVHAALSARLDPSVDDPADDTRPFQDHDVSPRMVNGRSMERPAHRVASVAPVRPAMRSAPIARLRRAAMILGPDRVLIWDLSS